MSESSQSRAAVEQVANGYAAEPAFFGESGRELFGWLHGRGDAGSARTGVVLCGTLGVESLSTHRALRILAASLAEAGIPSLRFDYAGAGDSVDPPNGAPRLAAYVDGVRTAIRVVRAHRSVDRIVLVALRAGALFAVKAAELEEVSGLVLWGPVVSGKRFVREWSMMAHRSERPDRSADGDVIHAAGFSLDRTFLDELAGCNLLQASPLGSPDCLLVERDELAPEDALAARLTSLGLRTERCRPRGFLASVVAEPHLTEVPVDAIRTIREWIGRTALASQASTRCSSSPSPRFVPAVILPDRGSGRVRVRERFLDPRETGGTFGIVSEPVEPAAWNGQCIVLVNAGSVHHIGPNRMHVEFSRELAAQGSRVCRVDLRGIGDSPVAPGCRDNDPYPAGAIEDVCAVVRELQRSGEYSRLALAGLCSGAWASFHAALALEGITDIVLVNPDFYGERSVVGKPASFVRPKDYSHYKHAARSWAKWKKLLIGRANLPKIVRVLWNEAGLRLASFRERLAGEQHQLDSDLTRLAVVGVRVGFVFSPGDGGLDFLHRNGASGAARLRRSGLLREVTITEADHPFSLPGARRRLGDTLVQWLRCDHDGRPEPMNVMSRAGQPAALGRLGDL